MRTRTGAAIACAAAVIAVVILAAPDRSGPLRQQVAGAAGSDAPPAPVRGCRDRIDAVVPPPGRRDTTIGPIAFKGLPGSYRYSSRHPDVGMKSIAVLRPGARVTLVVPGAQRRWLTLHYGGERLHRRRSVVHTVTLSACRRRQPHTLFSGGVGVDFARAPQRGRCAELIVWVDGRPRPLRERLFGSGGGRCGPRRLPSTKSAGVQVDCSRRSMAVFPDAFESPRNLVVGPLVLVGGAEPQPASVIREFGGQKFPLLVRAGHTVTIRLPQAERRFAGLAYGGLGKRALPEGELRLRDTAGTMTFVACGRGQLSGSRADREPVTFWSGAVVMRSPACVALEIYVDDEYRARHAMLDMGGRRCRL